MPNLGIPDLTPQTCLTKEWISMWIVEHRKGDPGLVKFIMSKMLSSV